MRRCQCQGSGQKMGTNKWSQSCSPAAAGGGGAVTLPDLSPGVIVRIPPVGINTSESCSGTTTAH